MNKKVLSMETRKIVHELSIQKLPKICVFEGMMLIRANLSLSGQTLFLVRTNALNLIIISSKFRLVYVSEPTSVLCIRASVVKELSGRFTRSHCTKSAGHFSRHGTLNSVIKQTLLELRRLYQTDGKRPDGDTMHPCEIGEQLVWDITVLAPSCLSQGSLCNPGTIVTEDDARKYENYRE